MKKIQFTIRVWELMRTSRFARPGSLYDASVAARKFGGFNRALGIPIVCEESTGVIFLGRMEIDRVKLIAQISQAGGCAEFIEKSLSM